MNTAARIALTSLAAVTLLAGCKDTDKADADASGEDPAMSGALGDPIMVDPELAGQNGAAVDAAGGPVELPPEQRSPEAVAAARQEAAKQAGGTLDSAPSPSTENPAPLIEGAATAAQIAESTRAASTDCAGKVEYSMSWAARLPAAVAVYPRGAVQEAAGTDKDGCALKVVNFVSPVDPGDIIDFYYTSVRKAGYNADYRMHGEDHVLGGSKGSASYVVFARKLNDGPNNGLTEVDIVAGGK